MKELTGPAIVVDVTAQSAQNRDYQVSVNDFLEWEKQHGTIAEQTIVLLNTGFGKFWNDHEKYTGTLKTGTAGVEELRYYFEHLGDIRKVIATEGVL